MATTRWLTLAPIPSGMARPAGAECGAKYDPAMRRTAALAILIVSSCAIDITSASASPPDPVPAFEEWAAAQGTPVEDAACHIDEVTTCYGLLAADPASPDWSGVLVGVAIDDSLAFVQVQSFPAAPSAPSDTAAAATEGTAAATGAPLMEPLAVAGATVQATGVMVTDDVAYLTFHIDNTAGTVQVGVFCETIVFGGTQYEGAHGGDDVFPGAALDVDVWFEGLPPGTTSVSGGTAYCVAHDEDFNENPHFEVTMP
jgi:hypothetical protein